ncbi:MAG: type II toxin-antitoxin system VapC family toxin [Chthoniobacterales bacterium]|nr:type II toxin-antitoxin system VapC family toxin [Chthoniobacterales bacterium]
MQIVDTNIVAYLLIDGHQTGAAQALRARDSDWRSEAFLLIEFTNVLASSVANRRMTLPLARDFLASATALFDGKLERLQHYLVLEAAARYRVSAYDARFLALAEQLGRRLVTEDVRLRRAAPALTQSLDEALASA